jgi:hypothetical protein
MSTSNHTLNLSWIGILLLTWVAFISLIVSMVQKEARIFEREAWENDGESVAIARAYTLATWTMLFSLTVSSYGFWRGGLSNTRKQTLDIVFSGGASACGSLSFACFILFFFFHRFGEDFEIGGRAMFSFGICCFFLAMLYFNLEFLTVRNGGRAKNPTVDSSSLI